MRLYSGKIGSIAEDVVRTLVEAEAVEVISPAEVRLDVEAVLKEYLRLEREISDEAKTRLEQRGMSHEKLGRIKAEVAKERGAPPPDETLPYLLEQILNMLFHSNNVEEIFADDVELRTKLTPVLKRHMNVEDELDKEVRSKIKNLEEGTSTFEVEYSRVMDQMKRKHGLS